ncbi:MAG: shikimate kinase [Hyphomicrobiaceae bacterium]|nr:shikimate kinase [Hyphomicrobiaceae bacterium]
MPKTNGVTRDQTAEPRRGAGRDEEAYLRLVGERVRLLRLQLGMSRKALSLASGVSERYLAELERGSGNASLLVLRGIAQALRTRVEDLASESEGRSIEKSLVLQQIDQLGPAEAAEARKLLSERFGRRVTPDIGRIAFVGLRGAGKSALAKAVAVEIGLPCVDLDREIEQASGMEVAEVLAVHGEPVYRRLERESLTEVMNCLPRAVIKTGGGLVLAPETYDLLRAGCFVIWVKASPEDLFERSKNQVLLRADGRNSRAKAELEAALRDREPLYALADAVVDTTGRSLEAVLDDVLGLIAARQEAKTQVPPVAGRQEAAE